MRDGQCAVEAAKANAVPSFCFGGIAMYGNFYNGFNPYITAPMNAQMNAQAPFTPSPMQSQPNPVSPPVASPAFLQVGTAKEFDNVTIQPGRQALIMAQNDPYIAFKSADAMGMVTTSLYRLEPVTADQINGPAPEYVTRSEFQQTIQQLIDSMSKPARAKKETVSE